MVYQGNGDRNQEEEMLALKAGFPVPDITFLLECDARAASQRIQSNPREINRFDAVDEDGIKRQRLISSRYRRAATGYPRLTKALSILNTGFLDSSEAARYAHTIIRKRV